MSSSRSVGTHAPVVVVDLSATRNRIRRLRRYVDSNLLNQDGFICAAQEECRSSCRPGDAFREGTMSHVGHRFDLRLGGRPLRIVVVGQESGWPKDPRLEKSVRRVSLDDPVPAGPRRQRHQSPLLHRAGPSGPESTHARHHLCAPPTRSPRAGNGTSEPPGILTGGPGRRVRFIEPPSPPHCDASMQQSRRWCSPGRPAYARWRGPLAGSVVRSCHHRWRRTAGPRTP